MISRFSAEIGTATLTAGLGLAAVVGALEFGIGWGDAGPEPGAFPFYIGLLVVAASIGNLVHATVGRHGLQSVFLHKEEAKRVASFFVPMLAFVVVARLLGLYVATALYLAFVMRVQGKYRLAVSIASGIAAAVIFYFVLEVAFQVPLMKGPLEAALGLY
ncbi:tripartite tricarboxylate transporter TctB family protein [Microvirga sp. HBU67558]|uniref:tripartite tricarboxylate transporter TctB family protein n=1 Tax=Microvirga TaxID=186650 RepID=UPI001B35D3AF|nr:MULTISPECIES: tripartite tricarboxylate transporter TctB family protein [unclassified Microvirga]MBQ0822008.1 tripartite tricarboxylate transporter TctB family protein [Microvirga sp. HBU67558]